MKTASAAPRIVAESAAAVREVREESAVLRVERVESAQWVACQTEVEAQAEKVQPEVQAARAEAGSKEVPEVMEARAAKLVAAERVRAELARAAGRPNAHRDALMP